MSWSLEQIKQQDMRVVLSKVYGIEFEARNGAWAAFSPFREESRKSFFVRQVADGHWLFKDFSANLGGSLIDFLWQYEKLPDFPSAFRRTREVLGGGLRVDRSIAAGRRSGQVHARSYSLDRLYMRFRLRDPTGCAEYLRGRGIEEELVDSLVADGTVVLNHYGGVGWCCFAVRDATGRLRGLFNRRQGGEEKFLLGERWAFSLDWDRLEQAETVYVCEGIIDALSLKSLFGTEVVVMALQGNQLRDEMARLLSTAGRIVAAVDSDEGGEQLWKQLCQRFDGHKALERLDLDGCADPNALLLARLAGDSGNKGRLSSEEKTDIAFAPDSSRSVGQRYGVHHSRVCELRMEARTAAGEYWKTRRPGPRNAEVDRDAECADLKAELEQMSRDHALARMRCDWLELQLSWQREEEPAPKGQMKKKKAQNAGAKERVAHDDQ